MRDSEQPKAVVFEVPDLELEPVPRLLRTAPSAHGAPSSTESAATGPRLFDDELGLVGPSIDLGIGGEHGGAMHFGAGASFDALGGLELEGNAHPAFAVEPVAARAAASNTPVPGSPAVHWPSGNRPDPDRLAIDPVEVALLAHYGEAPKSAYATPAYAYRVFARQRELKAALRPLEAERETAERERESALAELARQVRPEAERSEHLQRSLAPLVELEKIASARGEALSSVNAELTAQAGALDAELAEVEARATVERAHEADAQRAHDERDAEAKRAEAKLKRVHIEIRAAMQVAEQKLGPQSETIPEPEATQIAGLKARVAAVQPEVDQAKQDLAHAKAELDQAAARVGATTASARQLGRKKQALVEHYQRELDVRSRSMNESEQAQQAALADLGRAVLATRGAVVVPEPALARVRGASERADALLLRAELHLRALDAYDRPRAAQGVRLAATFAAIVMLLIALKFAL